MSHLVKLTVSVEENVPSIQMGMSPTDMYHLRNHDGMISTPLCKRLGETFILNVTPAFSGGVGEFSSNPEQSHNFPCYWDAFEAANHLLLGEPNNNSINGLIRSILTTSPTLGSNLVIHAEVITNEEFFSGEPIPFLQVAEARFVNCVPGRYMPRYLPYAQSGVGYNKDYDLPILGEFFKLAFSKAGSTEPTYLNVAPIPQFSPTGGSMMGGQFQPMIQPIMQDGGLYGANPNFNHFLDIESNPSNNKSLFISVRLDGTTGSLTWFDVKNYASGTVAFENSKIVCFDQTTSPITILAARIVAHQLRGGNVEFISIHRAFPGFDFGNTSQFI